MSGHAVIRLLDFSYCDACGNTPCSHLSVSSHLFEDVCIKGSISKRFVGLVVDLVVGCSVLCKTLSTFVPFLDLCAYIRSTLDWQSMVGGP